MNRLGRFAGAIGRGLLGLLPLRARTASALHGGAVWGSAQVTLPALEIAPPSLFWGAREVAIDALHHAIYAAATGAAHELIADRA